MLRSNHVGHVFEGVLNSFVGQVKTCESVYMMWTMKMKNDAS
jgi:hypothetical protein